MIQTNKKLKEIELQLRKHERNFENNFVELMSIKTQFEKELKQSVIPFVEKNYRDANLITFFFIYISPSDGPP